MKKLKNISGFPEWLPEQKIVEERLIERIKAIYQSFGFTPIETPAVELLSTLLSKGEIDKEVYAVRRLSAASSEEADLGLHFDLTVPFARYVAQHFSELHFPFKRYQLQKVWRGERPQKGRFREFYQFDIDIIARDHLPLACDAEVITVLDQVFTSVGAGKHLLRINDRKILLGLYESLGLDQAQSKIAIGVVDKIAKVGRDGVMVELLNKIKLDPAVAEKIVDLTEIRINPSEVEYVLTNLEIDSSTFEQGKNDLIGLLKLLPENTLKNIQVDLSLARGLDYYTGVIVEVFLVDHPQFGTLASGGRYDDLASEFINKKLPGVGVSFGITRFLDLAFAANLYSLEAKTISKALVALHSDEQRTRCNALAGELRANGIACEVSYSPLKLGKQIEYADNRGIPYIFFINPETGQVEVKDLRSKVQVAVNDLAKWCQDALAA